MKAILYPSRALVLLALAGLLGGCGQKGPLYMPKPQPVAPAKPAATPTAPADNTAPASR